MRLLAIDQGTTSTRGLVFEGDAPPEIIAALRHRQIYPQPGWVEHDPFEILQNIKTCVSAAGKVDAIGLANQGESCLAWDAITKAPLSPIIVWQDNRTDKAIGRLKADGVEPQIRQIAGLPLENYFAASKLRWLLDHNPDVQAALHKGRLRLGTTDSFWLDCLTGNYATDPTTASRTSLMNLAGLSWDKALCSIFGVPYEILAPIRPTASQFGTYAGIPITASIVDQQGALFGHGCRIPGDAKITFGTGAFALALAGETPPPAMNGLISTVAWQTQPFGTRYAVEGGVYDAGAAVEWAKRIGLLNDFADLQALDGSFAAIEAGLVFVPALSGLACPQWDRNATGRWAGITTATTRHDLLKSILEGVALQTSEVVAALDRSIPLGSILHVDGGLSASRYFLQFLAEVTGKTIMRSQNAELTAYGCALLAGHVTANTPNTYDAFTAQSTRRDWIDLYRDNAKTT
jgi:glycerol kinase